MQELQARHKGGRGESPRTPLTLAPPGIEISEREERLIEYDRRLYHSYSTYPKHFRAFSKSLIPCS